MVQRRKRIETLNKVKSFENINKNLQSFLEISPVQKEAILQEHAYGWLWWVKKLERSPNIKQDMMKMMISASILNVKDIHRENCPQIKLLYLQKVWIHHLGSWCIKSTLYKRLLYWNKIFKKIKQLLAKHCSSW